MPQHAPKGYRIKRFADGFYHVYQVHASGPNCIGEEISRDNALALAKSDKIRRGREEYFRLLGIKP